MNAFLWCMALSIGLSIAALAVSGQPVRLALVILAAVVLLIGILTGTGVIVTAG